MFLRNGHSLGPNDYLMVKSSFHPDKIGSTLSGFEFLTPLYLCATQPYDISAISVFICLGSGSNCAFSSLLNKSRSRQAFLPYTHLYSFPHQQWHRGLFRRLQTHSIGVNYTERPDPQTSTRVDFTKLYTVPILFFISFNYILSRTQYEFRDNRSTQCTVTKLCKMIFNSPPLVFPKL